MVRVICMEKEKFSWTIANYYYYYIALPHTGAIAFSGSYSESAWPVYINDLNCTGSELQVWQCPHNALSPSACYRRYYRDDAAVVCQPTEGDCRVTFCTCIVVIVIAQFEVQIAHLGT